MIGALFSQTATIVRASVSSRDALNQPIYGLPTRTAAPCRIEQIGTAEGDSYVVDTLRGFFPIDTVIMADDGVEEGGRRFTVEGTPTKERVPGFTQLSHTFALLRFVGQVVA